jgi:TatD DNase family protein
VQAPYIDVHTHNEDVATQGIQIANWHVTHTKPSALYFSAGLHPWYLQSESLNQELILLETIAIDKNCLAIGECGLDTLCNTDVSLQLAAFKAQIALAEKLNKPLVLHIVRAWPQVLHELKNFSGKFILHGFNNNATIANEALAMGAIFSFGKALLNEKSNAAQIISTLPLGNILFETDDKAINIKEIYAKAASYLNLELSALKLQVHENFTRIFAS